MGILAGLVGATILMGIAADIVDLSTFSASLVYSVCLLTMLGCSAAYNLASNAVLSPPRRWANSSAPDRVTRPVRFSHYP